MKTLHWWADIIFRETERVHIVITFVTSFGDPVGSWELCLCNSLIALRLCTVSQSLAAGLTSSHPVEKLRALPLWLSLQYLGHNGIVQKIKHATTLVRITNIGNMSRICT